MLAAGDGAVAEIGTRARGRRGARGAGRTAGMNVVVEGGERFRLVELTAGRAFATGRGRGRRRRGRRRRRGGLRPCARALPRARRRPPKRRVDVPDADVAAARLRARCARRLRRRAEAGAARRSVSPRERMKRLVGAARHGARGASTGARGPDARRRQRQGRADRPRRLTAPAPAALRAASPSGSRRGDAHRRGGSARAGIPRARTRSRS